MNQTFGSYRNSTEVVYPSIGQRVRAWAPTTSNPRLPVIYEGKVVAVEDGLVEIRLKDGSSYYHHVGGGGTLELT